MTFVLTSSQHCQSEVFSGLVLIHFLSKKKCLIDTTLTLFAAAAVFVSFSFPSFFSLPSAMLLFLSFPSMLLLRSFVSSFGFGPDAILNIKMSRIQCDDRNLNQAARNKSASIMLSAKREPAKFLKDENHLLAVNRSTAIHVIELESPLQLFLSCNK